MALINCPECKTQTSNTASKCNNCGFQINKPERGVFGKIFKWLFIIFNVLCLYWLYSYFNYIGSVLSQNSDDVYQTGTAIGSTIGTGLIMIVWVAGDIILGLFVLFTKPK